MIKALFAFAIISASQAALRPADDSAVFVQLDSKPMGNALLSLVQMHMQAGGALDELIVLLGEIRDSLLSQQTEDDELFKSQNATCNENTEIYQTELDSAETQIETSSDSLDNLRPALETLEREIETSKSALSTLESEQSAASEDRSSAAAIYAKNDYDFSDAIAAIEEAIDLMSQLKTESDVEFVQVGLKSLEARISRGLNKSSRMLFGVAVTSLAEMATTADQALVKRIIDLLEQIKQALKDSQKDDAETEEKAAAEYADYNKMLQDEIDSTKQRLNEQESKETQLQEQIETEEDNLAAAETKKETYSKLLDEQVAQCDNWKATYQTNTDNRSDELDVIDQVIKIVDERIVTMEGYLNERVNV
jgi:predicted  nucleic acid-binding Zn-ribbon protein